MVSETLTLLDIPERTPVADIELVWGIIRLGITDVVPEDSIETSLTILSVPFADTVPPSNNKLVPSRATDSLTPKVPDASN